MESRIARLEGAISDLDRAVAEHGRFPFVDTATAERAIEEARQAVLDAPEEVNHLLAEADAIVSEAEASVEHANEIAADL